MLHLLVSLLDALGIKARQTWQSQALLITVIIMIMKVMTIVINNYHCSTSQDGFSYAAVTNTCEVSMAHSKNGLFLIHYLCLSRVSEGLFSTLSINSFQDSGIGWDTVWSIGSDACSESGKVQIGLHKK